MPDAQLPSTRPSKITADAELNRGLPRAHFSDHYTHWDRPSGRTSVLAALLLIPAIPAQMVLNFATRGYNPLLADRN